MRLLWWSVGGGPSAGPPDDETLIRQSQSGSLAAFNRLVERYQRAAYTTAYRVLGDPEAAADATQDGFVSAYQHVGTFRGGSFKAWLLRIVTNACHDLGRYRQRRPATSLEQAIETPEVASLQARDETPEEGALRVELQAHIQRGLLTLPEDQRVAVVLADVQGLGYDEIAQATGATLGTVKSRIARGRARLRDYLMADQELLPRRFRP